MRGMALHKAWGGGGLGHAIVPCNANPHRMRIWNIACGMYVWHVAYIPWCMEWDMAPHL